MSSRILALAHALPEHRLEGQEVMSTLASLWPRLRVPPESSEMGSRYAVETIEALLEPRGIGKRMAVYTEHARRLAGQAVRDALERADVTAGEIDMVISVSCTGYVVPSLDAYLVSELGLRPDVVRLPITELGCSGGTAALGLAHRHLEGHPGQKVLVVAVELPSLTFQGSDRSLDNLTAALVFGDGAAAAVLTGAEHEAEGLLIEGAGTYLVPGTGDLLGFDLRDTGFHVVLDRRLPKRLGECLQPIVEAFTSSNQMKTPAFVAAHCGGPRILDAVQRAIGASDDALSASRATYREVGNVSSASILFVLEALSRELDREPVEGLGLGLGPGLSIELLKLRWAPTQNTLGISRARPAKALA